ncbi:MAG: pectinesterase family protein [Bacteroidales bacterium]|nr:pectinesterase family protein [Bacteroidales bacterium]MCM1146571.1 pectinesterase family protein [Bacteroidales bacterium]MCM1205963.1 pectinesterase family protein [Bacillota bacterium]MCM1510157.1 pectinesterase family protein [Clostridium sp.]
MKRIFAYLLVAFAAMTVGTADAFADGLRAFPGAEGYGAYVTGGRGGEVCYVTRLDDCSDDNLVKGTLRWALRHDNGGRPRTVLFNVSGTIYLTSKLRLQYGDVSILGQSAPGGGICLAGYNMYINKDNVIVRYIRFRAGDIPVTSMTGLDMENAKRVILDHCSMTWSMEECLTAYDTDYTTVQWCIIGEGLYNSKNSKGARAYATQWGGEHSTMHHTLITNSHSRAPRFNGVRSPSNTRGEHDYKVDSEFANNVVFNWSNAGAQYGGEYDKDKVEMSSWAKADPGYDRVYLLNNYYRPGPSTRINTANARYWCSPSSPYGEWYLSGNKFEVDGTYSTKTGVWSKEELEKVNADNLYGTGTSAAGRGVNLTGTNSASYLMKEIPYALSGMTYESADEAFAKVVTMAGASLPRYDEVDRRMLDEAAGKRAPMFAGASLAGEYGIIDSPDDIRLDNPGTYMADGKAYGNYPFLGMAEGDRYAVDTDGDGMPDAYEKAMGFDQDNAADGNDVAANGYTNLENYLNGIADGTLDKADYETSTVPVEPGTVAPATVTITYNTASPESVTVDFGTPVTLPAVLGGNAYTGWTGNGAYYETGKEYFFSSDVRLTPVVTVTYDFPGVEAMTVTAGTSVTLPVITREGYAFKGWTDGAVTYTSAASFRTCVTLTPVFEKSEGVSGSGNVLVRWLCSGSLDAVASQLDEMFRPLTDVVFSPTSLTAGSALSIVEKSKNSRKYAGLQPKTQVSAPDRDNALTAMIAVPEGITAKVTEFSFVGMKFGTDGGKLAVGVQYGEGEETILQSDINVNRDNAGSETFVDVKNFPELTITAGTPLYIRVYVYALGNTKQLGLRNLIIYTTWEGASAGVETCMFKTEASPKAGGKITQTPAGTEFEAGKTVTVTATPADGFFFENWTDNKGNVLGSSETLDYTVRENVLVTANFKSESEYAGVFDNCAPYDAAVRTAGELKVALHKASRRSDMNGRYRIFLHNGIYDFGTKALTAVPQNTSLIGESRDGVVVMNNPGSVSNYQEETPVLFIDQNQNNVYMQDLTVRQNRDWEAKKSAGQAIALRQRGKQAVYKNVALQGVQDTYYLNKADASAYFEDCSIAGEVDFIYGDGTAYFNRCRLQPVSSAAYITAPNTQKDYVGLVFNECTVERIGDARDAVTGYRLGRPWGDSPASTFINTTMNVLPADAGWGGMSGGLVIRFHEYGSKDADGLPLDLSKRSISACNPAAGSDSPVLTEDELDGYALDKVFAKVAEGWQPEFSAAQLAAPAPRLNGTTLWWNPVQDALGYAVVKDGEVIGFTTMTSFAVPDDTSVYTIRVANAMGGLGAPSPSATTGITEIAADAGSDAPMYNTAGQRVTRSARGIVIVRGKKIIR